MSIKIDIIDDRAIITSPYNADFISAIKRIGGASWDRARKVWSIPADTVEQAREIMRRVYGEDDRPNTQPNVSVRLTFGKEVYRIHEPIMIYGKTVASAYGRDSGARVGDDVAIVAGNPTSGGSVKNWATIIPEGCIAVLHNVPQAALQMELPKGVTAEVIEKKGPDLAALEAERERLLARLAEIDQLLA